MSKSATRFGFPARNPNCTVRWWQFLRKSIAPDGGVKANASYGDMVVKGAGQKHGSPSKT